MIFVAFAMETTTDLEHYMRKRVLGSFGLCIMWNPNKIKLTEWKSHSGALIKLQIVQKGNMVTYQLNKKKIKIR